MAEGSSGQELLVNLTAALENVAVACGLPKGWTAEPSFRLTSKGASLMVIWKHPSPSAEIQTKQGVGKKKKSKSTLERSAERGRKHKERQQRPSGQQLGSTPLNFSAKPFVPTTRPNSAPEGSRESGGRTTGTPTSESMAQISSQKPGTDPGPSTGMVVEDREKRKRDEVPKTTGDSVATMLQQIGPRGLQEIFRKSVLEAVVKGDAEVIQSTSRVMDSLEGQGAANRYVQEILSGRGVT